MGTVKYLWVQWDICWYSGIFVGTVGYLWVQWDIFGYSDVFCLCGSIIVGKV